MHPKAFDGFVDISNVEDVLEDELPLPPGVTGIYNEVNILATGLLQDMAESALGFFNRLELE